MKEIKSIISAKKPIGAGWLHQGDRSALTFGYDCHAWLYVPQGLFVISGLEVVENNDRIGVGPHYHVSISKNRQRCTSNEAKYVLKAFSMEDAEEDNHTPLGVARNFWLPVAERLVGVECPCKSDEPAIVEDKGDFVWRALK